MKTIIINNRLTREEKETHIYYDYESNTTIMHSTVARDFNKAKRQGWEPVVQYVYDDGVVCGMELTANGNAITIRNPHKKRVMSEKQMQNLHGHDDEDEDGEY